MTVRIGDRAGEGGAAGDVGDGGRLDVGPPRFDERRFLRMLGLTPSPDPVHIITAAQVQLRRWRRTSGRAAGSPEVPERIREITTARDVLLKRAFRATVDGSAD